MCMVFGGFACLVASGINYTSPTVHVLYAVPSDRAYDSRYATAIGNALSSVQAWYGDQLGVTFTISATSPQTCYLTQESKHYASVDGWGEVIADVQHCAPVEYLAQWETWVIFADVDHTCKDDFELGQGAGGITILHSQSLRGISLQDSETYAPCNWPQVGQDGWLGEIAHEVGHSFGLGHPEGGDESIMWMSWYSYPDTFLNDGDKAYLAEFLVNPIVRCEAYEYLEWCENNWDR